MIIYASSGKEKSLERRRSAFMLTKKRQLTDRENSSLLAMSTIIFTFVVGESFENMVDVCC